ncbi:MAG: hypothetical protein MI922_06240 [Bacteroidales bacterium]|nr:hypothetical protein [Bacteroidales bacterium]
MNKVIVFTYVVLSFAFTSCINKEGKVLSAPAARVFDNYLYIDDLKAVVPEGISKADSVALVKDHIDKWVLKQLLLHEAEINLTDLEKDVEKQIEDYRASLIIFKYEQNVISQKLDTVIKLEDIEEYYNQYSNGQNFQLKSNIVKSLLVKIPKDSPKLWNVRSWYKSDKSEDLTKLEQYCYDNNGDINFMDTQWIDFYEIKKLIPNIPYNSDEFFLRNKKSIELQDEDFRYFLRIYDYHLTNTVAPLDYVYNNIKSILLNKRKIQLINQLESEIYNNALDRRNFNIY